MQSSREGTEDGEHCDCASCARLRGDREAHARALAQYLEQTRGAR
ncbi:MAG: hypothetical protein OEW11_04230 [Nitrospirota bacterium]|nr:hypothetical protein [Nitrospirota bacterium]